MANSNAKHKLNISGTWYCTDPDDENGEGCVGCSVCSANADDFFAEDDNGNAYIKRQPITANEIELCEEQKEACIVSAIGNDGQSDT
ncbi:MAG: ferredoxin [Bacteriovoracaceae bacterium]|nr:ferredoxin [Bacteriovoracaceae bacterium]